MKKVHVILVDGMRPDAFPLCGNPYIRQLLDSSLYTLQARTVIDLHREHWNGTVVVMGGAWKGHPRMFEVFKKEMELVYPEAKVSLPIFEPVVGCAVLRLLGQEEAPSELIRPLKQGFSQFLYT